jgi:hypothetical protein
MEMNKLALLITACALAAPAFAREPRPHATKPGTRLVATHKAASRKPESLKANRRHVQPANPPEADLRKMDYPWETPS